MSMCTFTSYRTGDERYIGCVSVYVFFFKLTRQKNEGYIGCICMCYKTDNT